jgi:hypothetical protein
VVLRQTMSGCPSSLKSGKRAQYAPDFTGLEQMPLAVSHNPASWHRSRGAHTTGFEPTQAPDWQVSVCVQAFPSLQAEPSAFAGLEQVPVPGSHVPASWH